jgi:tetratricopeptide (TPR) repeat protein
MQVPVLTKLQGAQNLRGFAAYNLGIALLQAGHSPEALQQLEQAGQIASRDPASAAIRDKSNMVLGRMMLESARFDRAQQSFDRVRLDGPYSNQALAQRRMGRRFRRQLRESARSVAHPHRSRHHR